MDAMRNHQKHLGKKPSTRHQTLIAVTPRTDSISPLTRAKLRSLLLTDETTIMLGLDNEGHIKVPPTAEPYKWTTKM